MTEPKPTPSPLPRAVCQTCGRALPSPKKGRPAFGQEAILTHLRAYGPATRAELAQALRLPRTTIRDAVSALHAQGALHVVGQAPEEQPQPADKWGIAAPAEET